MPPSPNSKHRGYGLVLLLCVLPIVFSTLAGAAKAVFNFIEHTDVIAERKFDKSKIAEMIEEKIENIPVIYNLGDILISTDTRFFGDRKFEVKIYSMNYTSSSLPLADMEIIQHFPPLKESCFLIRGTREKNGIPTYHAETALEISGGFVNVLWRREFVVKSE